MSEEIPPLLVVMGVSGTGKSTVAGLLAGHLGWELREGDDLHPAANVAKMAAGLPLDDEDRWPWLDTIAAWIDEQAAQQAPGIVTCSALKRSYRDRLRRPNVVFVYLAGDRSVLAARMAARMDHFMPAGLLGSQLNTLEAPTPDENVIEVDVVHGPSELAAQILRELGRS